MCYHLAGLCQSDNIYACTICGTHIKSLYNMKRHIRRHLPDVHKLCCDRCDYSTHRTDAFKIHKLRCTGVTSPSVKAQNRKKAVRVDVTLLDKDCSVDDADEALPMCTDNGANIEHTY